MIYKFPESLIESLKSKECTLFIGSGISSWSGAPSWYNLILSYSNFLERNGICNDNEKLEIINVINKGDLLIAASYCKSLSTDSDFAEFIKEEFFDRNLKSHKIHELIISLGSDCYITTNYDSLIENAYQEFRNGLMLRRVNNDQPIEQASIQKHSSSKFIFKPHGDMHNVDSIILTQEDYRRIKYNMESTIDTLKHLLIQRPILYLGFGLTDPTFLLIKDFIAETYKGGTRQHFAIMPNVTELEKKFWNKNYGISLISYETINDKTKKHDNLLILLEELKNDLSLKKEIGDFKLSSSNKLALLRYCDTLVFSFDLKKINLFNLDGIVSNPSRKSNEFVVKKNISIQQVLQDHNKLIIIGEPGSGKSTSLEYFSSQIASKTKDIIDDDFTQHSIPILIHCKEYKGSLFDLISSSLPITIDKEITLNEGLYTIIIDAVNEIPKEYYETKFFEQDLKDFIEKYPNNKFHISTRSLNYISFLDFPIFEIKRLNYNFVRSTLESKNYNLNDVSNQLLRSLSSPFFFKLFLDYSTSITLDKITPKVLLSEYFISINKDIEKDYGYKISVLDLFSDIGYRLTNLGEINIDPIHFITKLTQSEFDKIDLFNILISKKFLLPDGEGKIGFVHQTILEFLSAYHLVKLYSVDEFILDEKITDSRWDETIMLFVSLLDMKKAKQVIEKIVKKDIFYAYSIYDFATIKNSTLKKLLIDQLLIRLNDPKTILRKKDRLGWLISNIISDKKYLPDIIEFLDDEVIGPEVAFTIAKINNKKSIPKIIEKLFEKGNSFPNGYAKAIIEFNDERFLEAIIDKVKNINEIDSNELLIANVAYILSHFETSLYLPKIMDLFKSVRTKDKVMAIKLLDGNRSSEVVEFICNLLDEKDDELKRAVIYSLIGNGWLYDKNIITSTEIVEKSFENLANDNIGSHFSDYLKDLNSEDIINRAHQLILTAKNGSFKINLANIIFDKFNQLSKNVIIDHLSDFKIEYSSALHQILFLNISELNREIIPLVNITDEARSKFIIENYINESDEISDFIDSNICIYLLEDWEKNINSNADKENHFYWYYSVPKFLSLCSKHIKSVVLNKLNDKNYANKSALLSIVSRLKLKKKDLSEETLNWLFEEMTIEYDEYDQNYTTTIIGMIGDEEFAHKKLKPLLESENPILRNNAYIAIENIEDSINKRLIIK
ncbi:SIR2 family protein [Chryseobacterium sp. PBS4-4]|uniref:SIR2 family protein n=1 Tax=Chryseobacterium edaphi TaxID=2976532 RepID=A0ABT2W268_9FLAO|nr:SIR2 family protein [Chryseobacterium edaphi]MCU7616323.1 SIR2 family protein [Chryseobacterium edaphi]